MVIKYPNQIANGNSARKFHIKNIISYGKSMESDDIKLLSVCLPFFVLMERTVDDCGRLQN